MTKKVVKTMKGIIVLFVFIVSYERIVCLDFVDCGTKDASVSSITVSDCTDSDQICPFKSGASKTIDVQFTPKVDSSSATVKAWGFVSESKKILASSFK